MKKLSRRALIATGLLAAADAAWELSGGTGVVRLAHNLLTKPTLDDLLQTKSEQLQDASIEAFLQREIHKWDDWVLEFLDPENSDETKIRIRINNRHYTHEDLRKRHVKETMGRSGSGRIVIVQRNYPNGESDIKDDGLDHEVSHALIDNDRRASGMGIVFRKGYQGPTYADFRRKMLNDLENPERRKMMLELLSLYSATISFNTKVRLEDREVIDIAKELLSPPFDIDKGYDRGKYHYTTEIIAHAAAELMQAKPFPYWCDNEFLDMFSQMHYKGDQVFAKAVEKKRIAVELFDMVCSEQLESIVLPREIQQRLVYATSGVYKGEQHLWTPNSFSFACKLPQYTETKK